MTTLQARRYDLRRVPTGAFIDIKQGIEVTTYEVKKIWRIYGEGWKSVEYEMKPVAGADEKVFLEVERDDGDWLLALWRETVSDLTVDGERYPRTISFGGNPYVHEEHGTVHVTRQDADGQEEAYGQSMYYDYEGPGDLVFSIEHFAPSPPEYFIGHALTVGDDISEVVIAYGKGEERNDNVFAQSGADAGLWNSLPPMLRNAIIAFVCVALVLLLKALLGV